MKNKLLLKLFFILFLFGCSAPIMKIPSEINKEKDILIFIDNFKDYTDKYNEEYGIEHIIANKVNKEFKGILLNYGRKSEIPRYSKATNPFIVFCENDDDSPLIKDIIIQGDIETIFYGNVNESIAAGFLALGFIGAAITESHNKNNVYGFISVKTKIIDCKNDKILYDGIVVGKSKAGKITELTQREATRLAIDDYSKQILDILSKAR